MLSNSTGLSAALKRHSNRCNAAFYIHPRPAALTERDRSEAEAVFSFTITLLCDVWMTGFYIITCFSAFASLTYDSTGDHHLSSYRKLPALRTAAVVFIMPAVYVLMKRNKSKKTSSGRKIKSEQLSSSTFGASDKKKKKKKKKAAEEGGRETTG